MISGQRRAIDWFFGKVQLLVGGVVAVTGAVLKATPADWSAFPLVQQSLAFLQTQAWWIIVTGPIAVGIAQAVRRTYGTPWLADTINKVLTEFRDDIYKSHDHEAVDKHRVTLFRHKALRLYWGTPSLGWLKPVARSGHLTQRGIVWFRAPDRPVSVEGVAGAAWRCKTWVIIPNGTQNRQLPNIDGASSEGSIREYAAATFVTPSWVRQRLQAKRPMAKSFCAIRIQVKGKPWGVLVLDSQSEIPPDEAFLAQRFAAMASVLSPLLERV